MAKVQNLSEISPELPFTEYDFYDFYTETFRTTELGRMHSLIPFKQLVEDFGLRRHNRHKCGRKPFFTPEGKLALAFLMMYTKLSDDTGSNTKGGLYTEVYKGQMVTEFNDWCFDESRQPGDTGIVYNEGSYTGYHVIYFVGTDAPYWQVQVRNAMKNADYTQWNNALVKDITATEASGMKYLV